METIFDDLIESLNEAIDYTNGDKTKAKKKIVHVPELPSYSPQQIKEIRSRIGLTQTNLSIFLGVSSRTVESWEIGKSKPLGSSRRLLQLISENPQLVHEIEKLPVKN